MRTKFLAAIFSLSLLSLCVPILASAAALNVCAKTDVNNDKKVDAQDTAFIRNNIGCTTPGNDCHKADVNRNGKVDNFDVLLVRGHFWCTFGGPNS
ncbi:MAG: dockerin type I domain-containing protein [Candidatus Staskawiczbacteria bacterium]